jgi:transcriptional regulator with GAF, ATPase, and Fis domain
MNNKQRNPISENHDEMAFLIDFCRATLEISELVQLDDVLQRVVDVARHYLGADYGVLAVQPQETIAQKFIFSGLSAEMAAQIKHLPEGKGLLAAVSSSEQAVRVADVQEDARFGGFPRFHPQMRGFLGVPIVVEGEVYGRLYLSRKPAESPFTAADSALLETLAGHAAVAIKKTELLHHNRDQHRYLEKRNKQLAALDKATMAIAGELALEKVLQQIIDSGRELVNAQYGALGCPAMRGSWIRSLPAAWRARR